MLRKYRSEPDSDDCRRTFLSLQKTKIILSKKKTGN